MFNATFFTRLTHLDEVGLDVVEQDVGDRRAVLGCRVIVSVSRGAVTRRTAHVLLAGDQPSWRSGCTALVVVAVSECRAETPAVQPCRARNCDGWRCDGRW